MINDPHNYNDDINLDQQIDDNIMGMDEIQPIIYEHEIQYLSKKRKKTLLEKAEEQALSDLSGY